MPILAMCNLKAPCEIDLYLETYVLEDISFTKIFYNYLFKNKLLCADILHEFIHVRYVIVWTDSYRRYLTWY
jgi:hypothetical protein